MEIWIMKWKIRISILCLVFAVLFFILAGCPFAESIQILQGLLTPVIACIAVYIAYQQHKTARYRLRLDLYNKRFNMFNSTKSLLGKIVSMGDVTNEELSDFHRSTAEAIFLFKQDIPDYLGELDKQGSTLQRFEKRIKSSDFSIIGDKEREEILDKRGEIFSWFTEQFEVCQQKFGEYLNFENI